LYETTKVEYLKKIF